MQVGSLNFNFNKVGKGRHVTVRAWAENIANAWLPIQIYGDTSKSHNFNSKVKSLVSTHSACPCKNYLPRCSQPPRELTMW